MSSKAMARKVFSHMRSTGLITRRGIDERNILRLAPKRLLDIAQELAHMTEPPEGGRMPAGIGHCASLSLAGGRSHCAEINCRLRRVHRLGQFAAFYTDRMYMRNPFSDYVHRKNYGDEDDLKRQFADDVRVATYLKPMLDQGLVMFVSETRQICPTCLGAAMGLGRDSGRTFLRASRKLSDEFLDNTEYVLERLDPFYSVVMSGPELYYDHGARAWFCRELPPPVSTRPRIVRKLEREGRIRLSRTLSRELGLHKYMARDVIHNVAYHLLVNKALGTSLVTDRELHLAFLRHASQDHSMEERNTIAQKYLTAMVPFLDDVPIPKLLALREREAESFVRFRARFTNTIDEFRSEGATFTRKSARMIYQDVLAPELARLDLRVRKAKRDLVSSATRSVVGMVGAISFGLFSGLIGTEVAAIVKAVGIVSFGSDLIKKTMALGDAKKKIEEDDLYYLWRVRKAARRA